MDRQVIDGFGLFMKYPGDLVRIRVIGLERSVENGLRGVSPAGLSRCVMRGYFG